tara:strand:- start:5505 stop:7121 length:1617 start_codon:yes stop_codon:yes gene_type:complete
MVKKINDLLKKIVFVSKLTNIGRKKLRIVLSIGLSNISIGLDILIIIIFSNLLIGQTSYSNPFVKTSIEIIVNNKWMLPLLVIARFLFLFIERINLEYLSLDVQQNLKLHVMKESFGIGNMSTADIHFFTGQVAVHIATFYKTFAFAINSFLQVLVYSIFLLFTELELFTYFLLGAIVLAFPSRVLLGKAKHYQHLSFNSSKKLSSKIQRIIDNVILINILKTSDYEFNELNTNLEEFKNAQKKNVRFGSINSLIPSFFTVLTLSIIFLNFEIAQSVTLEFVAVLIRLFQSLGSLNNGIGLTLNSSVHVEEMFNLQINKPVRNLNNLVVDEELSTAVKFQNLSFKYFNSDELIFDNQSIEFEKNKHTVVTGPNGSGKSTLLGLVSGLYVPISGKSIKYTNKVGYVGVTPLVFEGSIRDNLLYGNDIKINDEKLISMLEDFNFYNDKIINLDDNISNRSLSSGQLQKISFIRCLLNESSMLLLDESMSNLDTSSKKHIFDVLKEKNVTIINCTHNISDFEFDYHLKITVENQDRILSFI